MRTRMIAPLAAWLGLAAATAAQPLGEPTAAESLFRPVGLSRELGVPEPLPQPSPPVDLAPAPAAPTAGAEFLPKGDLTYLPKSGGRGFGVTDVEALGEMRFPFAPDLPPLKVRPGFAVRFWDGPAGGPDLPGTVYDLYADVGWRPRPAEWLFVDLKATLGWYTDLENTGGDAFRP